LNTAWLVTNRNRPFVGRLAHRALRYFSGMEVPSSVVIGPGLVIHHNGFGTVLHDTTVLGARVHLFHGVTVGRADVTVRKRDSTFEGVVIEDDVYLCAGAKVLGKEGGKLVVGRGTVVGANAVLLQSTGPWEIWGGVPARLIGKRAPLPDGGGDD
jgi:serine O-acetyltransferase